MIIQNDNSKCLLMIIMWAGGAGGCLGVCCWVKDPVFFFICIGEDPVSVSHMRG